MNPTTQPNDPSDQPDQSEQPNTFGAESTTESTNSFEESSTSSTDATPETSVSEPTDVTPEVEATPVTTSEPTEALVEATPTPVVPVTPTEAVPVEATPVTTPIQPTPVVAPTPAPNKSNKKAIIIIASIVGGLILLAAIGAILYTLLMTVSKKDYEDAAAQYNTLSDKSQTLGASISTIMSSVSADKDDEFDSSISDAEKAISEVKAENKKLGEMKAVRVGEGKELYKTFSGKVESLATYSTGIVDSLKKLHPALMDCAEISGTTTTATRESAIQTCSETLNDINNVPNADFDAYIKSLKSGYGTYATNYEKLNNLSDPFGKDYEQYQSLRKEILEAEKEVSTAKTDFVSNIKDHAEDQSVKASANALKDYLVEQKNK